MANDDGLIREIIENWATATRDGRKDDVLTHHTSEALIFDALPPLKYESSAAYRASFDKWWPETADDKGLFELNDLTIVSGDDVAFAHAIVRCGGTAPDGSTFEETVRLTHCCRKRPANGKSCIHIPQCQLHFPKTRDNNKLHPRREVGRFNNGQSFVAIG